MRSRFLWNADSPCTKLQYLTFQNTVMAVVTAVRTRVSCFLISLAKICISNTGKEVCGIKTDTFRKYVYSKLEHTFPWLFTNYNGQQRFCPIRKNVCLWCIFGCWIQICLQNFSVTHIFHSRLKGWNLLRQDTKVCLYHGRHEEFKDFFSKTDGIVFCNDVCSVVEVFDHECNPDK